MVTYVESLLCFVIFFIFPLRPHRKPLTKWPTYLKIMIFYCYCHDSMGTLYAHNYGFPRRNFRKDEMVSMINEEHAKQMLPFYSASLTCSKVPLKFSDNTAICYEMVRVVVKQMRGQFHIDVVT